MKKEKVDATILGIIYHPEIRDVLTEAGKYDIAEMVRTLVKGYCPFAECRWADQCNNICDWMKSGCPVKGEILEK